MDESEDEEKKKETLKEKFEGLCKVMKDVLGDRVAEVVVSNRNWVTGGCGYNWRVRTAEALGDSRKKTMEINPEDPKIEKLRKRAVANKNDNRMIVRIHVLYVFLHLPHMFDEFEVIHDDDAIDEDEDEEGDEDEDEDDGDAD